MHLNHTRDEIARVAGYHDQPPNSFSPSPYESLGMSAVSVLRDCHTLHSQNRELQRGYWQTEYDSAGCPGCKRQDGKLLERCELHKQIDKLREEKKHLPVASAAAALCSNSPECMCWECLVEKYHNQKEVIDKLPTCWRVKGEGDERELVKDFPVVPWVDYVYVLVSSKAKPIQWARSSRNLLSKERCFNSREAAKFAQEYKETC